MTVAIIDYGSGNLRSAAKAFERAARTAGLGEAGAVTVTDDPETVRRADRIVLPGVGAFADCKAGLAALPGMIEALEEAVLHRGRPFLGICVGMQLMASVGHEYKDTPGLGWIAGAVSPLAPADPGLKIPHMGWNALEIVHGGHPVLDGLDKTAAGSPHTYFVHSYGFTPADPQAVKAVADYGGAVAAVIARDNLVGTQFHPEKSQATGLALIANFLDWRP
ncbi:MAG: imidazole glycerol phosphate synthase subunit HisH [Alphaproteobacteria bacterium]|jgi:glutamine amidotransferase|nr:imidazole glycerol phosphate synthase subunit HisH [Alphaproteobacteria bacterium]